MSAAVPADAGGEAFVHEAMPYQDDAEYLYGVLPYIDDALATDRPVLVEVPGRRLDLVRDALGGDAVRVWFGDMSQDGRNPGRIIPRVLRRFAEAHPGRRVAVVGEPMWAGRSAHEYAAAVQHEALINLAFTGYAASVLCPYNLTELPERALGDAERTHPRLVEKGVRRDSTRFADPRKVVEDLYAQQFPPPATAEVFEFTRLALARRAVQEWATSAGLPADRVADLVIAVSEAGGNSVVYGGGGATLFRWIEKDWLVCEVRDNGHITDPLVGQLMPAPSEESGRGLVVANYLVDLVQINTGPSGTRVRLWMKLPARV